jgi:hypothetical protein
MQAANTNILAGYRSDTQTPKEGQRDKTIFVHFKDATSVP